MVITVVATAQPDHPENEQEDDEGDDRQGYEQDFHQGLLIFAY